MLKHVELEDLQDFCNSKWLWQVVLLRRKIMQHPQHTLHGKPLPNRHSKSWKSSWCMDSIYYQDGMPNVNPKICDPPDQIQANADPPMLWNKLGQPHRNCVEPSANETDRRVSLQGKHQDYAFSLRLCEETVWCPGCKPRSQFHPAFKRRKSTSYKYRKSAGIGIVFSRRLPGGIVPVQRALGADYQGIMKLSNGGWFGVDPSFW